MSAKYLVPGDVIRIRMGDIVPADCLIREGSITVDYSALTGESIQRTLVPSCQVYGGAAVISGECTLQVEKTGQKTFYGNTVSLISSTSTRSHSGVLINTITVYLSTMLGVLLTVAALVILIRSNANWNRLIDLFPLLLLLLASSIPVALPTMIALTTALASAQLSKCGVITSRLDALQDSARMDILCCDKTGTITENKLQVTAIATFQDFDPKDLIRIAGYACYPANKDPIDLAFMQMPEFCETYTLGHDEFIDFTSWFSKIDSAHVQFIPFDPFKRRFTTAILEFNNQKHFIVKGSVAQVLSKCKINPETSLGVEKLANDWGSKGWRCLAVAASLNEPYSKDSLTLVGLVALSDPPRADSKENIKVLQDLGIEIVMLTGDSLAVAKQVARLVGLDDERMVCMSELRNQKVSGIAQVYPQDKHRIVHELQQNGVLGMIGDGVNDAAALKMAEVGIAMKNATDIAKKSASFILTEPGLKGIAELVVTGRRIHHRITTWILNKLIKTCLTTVYTVFCFLMYNVFVLDAFHMVILLFLVDFLTLALASDPVRCRESTHKTSLLKPQKYQFKIILSLGTILGILSAVEIFFLVPKTESILEMQTMHLELMYFFSAFTILSVRERSWFWRSMPSIWMLLSIFTSVFGLIAIVSSGYIEYLQTSIFTSFQLLASAALCFLVNDSIKVKFFRVAQM